MWSSEVSGRHPPREVNPADVTTAGRDLFRPRKGGLYWTATKNNVCMDLAHDAYRTFVCSASCDLVRQWRLQARSCAGAGPCSGREVPAWDAVSPVRHLGLLQLPAAARGDAAQRGARGLPTSRASMVLVLAARCRPGTLFGCGGGVPTTISGRVSTPTTSKTGGLL